MLRKSLMNKTISNNLIIWYLDNKRDLPWRQTSNPYFIWVSEVILQQTRVLQGLPYYYRFIEEFSSVNLLAQAPLDKILKLWQGLGYYSRARNMHIAAKQVMDKYEGVFPSTYKELLNLKGVGEYTAAAVASLAYNEPVAVVDGNVIRVISRLFGTSEPVDKPSVFKEIRQQARLLLPEDNAAIHNQAIMEFGALQCVPVNPDCLNCPLMGHCLAFKHKVVEKIPFKQTKVKVRNRFFYYFVIHDNNHIFFQRRNAGDIWEGLYEFPLVEASETLSIKELPDLIKTHDILSGNNFSKIEITGPVKHILTHQRLEVYFIHLRTDFLLTNSPERWLRIEADNIRELAVPRVIDRYIRSNGFNKISRLLE